MIGLVLDATFVSNAYGRVLPVDNRGRVRGRLPACHVLLIATSTIALAALVAAHQGEAQTPPQGQPQDQQPPQPTVKKQGNLPRITISGRRPPGSRASQKQGTKSPAPKQAGKSLAQVPSTSAATGATGGVVTPLNGNAVAPSSTRLGLTVRETPASVEVVDQQTMQDQGYRTTTEIAKGAVGVLDVDSSGAPANFSMRGFTYGQVNVLYNGISVGLASDTSRVMDTGNLSQVEFLKGPSALMSGFNAIGGSVNLVTKQPTTGPIQSELDLSMDSLGTIRSHYGSGGSSSVPGIHYRIDVTGSKIDSFSDGDYRDLSDFSTQVNFRATDAVKMFVAAEYKRDSGHAYWGTPLVPTSFAGPFAIGGVVSGTAVNTFDGSIIGAVTVDSRTLNTNYNVANNATGAEELWLRTGVAWKPLSNVIIKDQVYFYQAKRSWLDSETYAFDNSSNTIDRDRFFVTHYQHVVGNNTDLLWDSHLFGMDNRLAAQLQVSRNWITFVEEGNPNAYPYDTVPVIDPAQGAYGPEFPDTRNRRLDDVAVALEDRLKITPAFALIGGVRVDDWTLYGDGINFDGTSPFQPFTQTWRPVSYRAAFTYEPIHNLTLYSMYATSYDPAAANIFSVTPGTSLALTSADIYEAGVKQLLWGNRAEWTFAAYDITRRNVYVQTSPTTFDLAGEIVTKGYELSTAARPTDGLKLWGNVAWTNARFENFNFVGGSWTGNTPSNVAPIIINAGASYRFNDWRWPVEIGGSVRHVGNRFLYEDDATIMDAYTTADVYAFVDIPGKDFGRPDINGMRLTFRVRNLTNAVYAALSDPGYPDQVYLGDPRTYEVAAHFKW
jgi:iron complex outermembrane recepter protein